MLRPIGVRLNKMNFSGKSKALSNVPPPITENHDMIGPPNPVSNLRPMILRVAPDESPLEKEYRLAREETAKWNEIFWSKHNTSFFKVSG
uniref:Apoptogenic protein 1, mitochondrial n=1 Tax=Timema douglasi TaxID=61478 RepID=A0A7R8VRL5_TIMDO|nr:unnamed protein product [Timema douglasi]